MLDEVRALLGDDDPQSSPVHVIHECRRCGTTVETTADDCPRCGTASIARLELE